MKKITILFVFLLVNGLAAQEVRLLKGAVTENLIVQDSTAESYSIYLPTSFDIEKSWPVLFVIDMDGNGKKAMSFLASAAEQEGYILASSNNVSDTLTIAQNVLVVNRMFNSVTELLPVSNDRIYVGGFTNGARFASLLPSFIKGVKGVLACGSALGNMEILSTKNPFQFVGLVNRSDYSFPEMLSVRKALDQLKIPNQLLVFDGPDIYPGTEMLVKGFQLFTLSYMAKSRQIKENDYSLKLYNNWLKDANALFTDNKPWLSHHMLKEMQRVFRSFTDLDSLKNSEKVLRKSKVYKEANRSQNGFFVKESFAKDDYGYYLEDDVITYNYSNLGWWKYQMEELDKLDKSKVVYERQMASRLRSFINALISDNIDVVRTDKQVDMEALIFLNMLKTITAPKDYESYLKVISISAKLEDFDTSLFYLEELLKAGYKNKQQLYEVDNTALLRITPEYNALVAKYLKEARYEPIKE